MILIPVKRLEDAKQRLAPALEPEQRKLLAEAMVRDVLAAVAAWRRRPAVAVVTSDPQASRLARHHGFEVIADTENDGETEAIAMATRVAQAGGAEETLVIPGDAPLVEAWELEAIAAAAPAGKFRGAVLAAAHDRRGTNAVLRRPAALFPLRFGNDSFAPHLEAARATGTEVVVLELPGVALDVDTPADLAALLAAPCRTRSQRLLRSWRIGDRLAALSGHRVIRSSGDFFRSPDGRMSG